MPPSRLTLAAVVAVPVLAGCGGGALSTTAISGLPGLSGSLTVLAAASLAGGFGDAKLSLDRASPRLDDHYSFAGSQTLVSDVQAGAAADVIATADTRSMTSLVAAGLVESPRIFARNTLEIAVARGNPRAITGLGDLARPGLAVVLADPAVPAGNFARQALRKAAVSLTPKSNELDVEAALEKVRAGDADAAIVYVTDVEAAGAQVTGVEIPPAQNVVAEYPIAVLRGASNHRAAQAFVDQAVAGIVARAVRHRGFLAP